MYLVVSFCTVDTLGRSALGVLNASTGEFRALDLPGTPVACAGITGLAAHGPFLYAAVRQPAGLLVFDRSSLRLLNHHTFTQAADLHSIWVTDETLYLVSTGTDEVIAARMRGPKILSEDVFWRPFPAAERADLHHLNAIYGWKGDLFVAGFGRKSGKHWTSAREGFIANVTRGYTVASGIYHPHSVMTVGEGLAYCESPKGTVSISGQPRIIGLPGYSRGLCRIDRSIFAGTSGRRRISRSTGELNEETAHGVNFGKCAVSKVSVDSFAIENTFDLTAYGEEIYDLLPLEDVSGWPFS